MTKKRSEKLKRRSSRKLRQLRLLFLICIVAGTVFYRIPLSDAVQGFLPSGKPETAAASGTQVLPAQEAAVTARKGTVYTVGGRSLKALKANGALLWAKTLEAPGAAVLPSYDGVFVRPESANILLRYSALGKYMNEVPVPENFSHVYESVNGILFEDRQLRQYTWTDIKGKVLGTQLIPEAHILKTAVDPETGDTVIATLKSDGGTLESALHRFDASGRLTGARTFRDAVLLHMQFMESQLVVVLDDRIINLDQQMKDRWMVREPARYQAVSFGTEHFWVDRIQTGFQEVQTLQCYNKEGKALFSLPFKDPLTLLEAGEGRQVAVVSGQHVQIYSEKGILNAEIQLAKVPHRIQWLNEKYLLIYYGDAIGIENINKRNPL